MLIVIPEWEVAVGSLDLLEAPSLRAALSGSPGPAGRTHTALLPLEGCERQLLLRPLRHGGLLRGLLGPRLFGLGRPIAELQVNAHLRARGAPVPCPVLVLGRRIGPFWEAAVGTVHEQGSVDAARFLRRDPSRRRILRAAQATGRAIRQIHDAGVRHPDLHVGNLLLREGDGEIEALVVDLDGVRLVAALSPGRRMHELARLYRSLRKGNFLEKVGRRGIAVFLGAYTGGDRRLRRALLARRFRHRLLIEIHALAYRRTQGEAEDLR
ncbi:MAG: lipopolysaccharide kinase InaA family protein [Myxococcota bacterium]